MGRFCWFNKCWGIGGGGGGFGIFWGWSGKLTGWFGGFNAFCPWFWFIGFITTLGFTLLPFFVVWPVTGNFFFNFGVGAGSPFSAIQINCYSINEICLNVHYTRKFLSISIVHLLILIWKLTPFIFFYFYTSLTALMHINRDFFFNFGILMIILAWVLNITAHINIQVNGDSFFIFEILDDCLDFNLIIGISSS